MGVRKVWATPDGDNLIAYMARVSNPQNQGNTETAPRLIGYLIRHKHWSPFEMVNLCVEIETTRDVGRQLLRHRSLTFQEFSQRYASTDALHPAPVRPARMQDPKNRQASLPCGDEDLALWWDDQQFKLRAHAQRVYREATLVGIAKEVARAVLPEGLTPTRLYANGTLRSWLHFLDVRLHPGAQEEIVVLAGLLADVVRTEFPQTYEAWREARDG